MDSYAQHYDDAMNAQFLDDKTVEKLWLAFFADKRVRHIQASKGAVGGFYEDLMAGWRPALGTCPYLERGSLREPQRRRHPLLHGQGHRPLRPSAPSASTTRPASWPSGRSTASSSRRATIPAPCEGCELAKFAVMNHLQLMRFGLKGLYNRLLTPPGFGAART